MSEQNQQPAVQADVLQQLQTLLGQTQAQGAPQPSAWQKPAANTPADILGVSIPVSIETGRGKLRVYLNFSGDHAASPESLMTLIEQLDAAGLPLDLWQSKSGWGSSRKTGWRK
jgi:hypothetical protein